MSELEERLLKEVEKLERAFEVMRDDRDRLQAELNEAVRVRDLGQENREETELAAAGALTYIAGVPFGVCKHKWIMSFPSKLLTCRSCNATIFYHVVKGLSTPERHLLGFP